MSDIFSIILNEQNQAILAVIMDDFDDRCACCNSSQSAASNIASEVIRF